ncbi:hypothetical protein PGT21_016765 [Puccinia graminis f. sp. tritici]|uniref:Uncharacterized protein n=1 Tax=Puccinia graminis f. sp. tritici TaxID=56615 RepID=A0A5B0QXK2_PUCGR|nr:hypothetical protein PGT21_016765 [Puccinia graminis f. sp. tritici]
MAWIYTCIILHNHLAKQGDQYRNSKFCAKFYVGSGAAVSRKNQESFLQEAIVNPANGLSCWKIKSYLGRTRNTRGAIQHKQCGIP